MTEIDENTPRYKQPKLWSYCSLMYAAFLGEHTVEDIDGVKVKVWQGHVTKTAKAVGIPDGVYRRVLDKLEQINCVEQLQRGHRGNAATTLLLFRPPTSDVWDDSSPDRLTRGLTPAILSGRIGEIEKRLEGVDIKQALVDLQKQIDDINKNFPTTK